MKKTVLFLYLLLIPCGAGLLYEGWIFSLPAEAFDWRGVVLVSEPQWVHYAMGLWIGFMLALAIRYPFKQRQKFWKIFGHHAASRYDWKTRAVIQPVVDAKLASLAHGFLDACAQEEQLTAKSNTKQAFRGATEHAAALQVAQKQLGKLEDARSAVEQTKDTFWSAHTLARDFFFTTRPKADDYVKRAKGVTKSPTAMVGVTA